MTSTPTRRNEMKVTPEFRALRPTDDMRTVARLLFDTDPYIYADLFGDLQTAEEVLPYLFARNTGVFNYMAYHIALLGGKIVGLSSLYKHSDKWNEPSVRMAFAEAGKKLPPSFDANISSVPTTTQGRPTPATSAYCPKCGGKGSESSCFPNS